MKKKESVKEEEEDKSKRIRNPLGFLRRRFIDETIGEYNKIRETAMRVIDGFREIDRRYNRIKERAGLFLGFDCIDFSELRECYAYRDLISLEKQVRRETDKYMNSAVVSRVEDPVSSVQVEYDLRDLGIIIAIRNIDTLIVGPSRSGKTLYGYSLLAAIYGLGNFAEKTVSPTLDVKEFTDRDMGVLKRGGRLSKSLRPKQILGKPAILINEPNRAVPELQNLFINILDNQFEDEGVRFQVGVKDRLGRCYQVRIFTMNEGAEYIGTSDVDQAIRERLGFCFPIQAFPSTLGDMQARRRSGKIDRESFRNRKSYFNRVLNLNKESEALEISDFAYIYFQYLGNLDNCVKTEDGRKREWGILSGICENGCHHNREDKEICGNIRGVSVGTLENIVDAARGFALVRSYKVALAALRGDVPKDVIKRYGGKKRFVKEYVKRLKVEAVDLRAAAPFVLYGKLRMKPSWVETQFEGDVWRAVNYVVEVSYNRLIRWHKEDKDLVERAYLKGKLDEEDRRRLERRVNEVDPWAFRLDYLRAR